MKKLIIAIILIIAGNNFSFAQTKEDCDNIKGTWDSETQKCKDAAGNIVNLIVKATEPAKASSTAINAQAGGPKATTQNGVKDIPTFDIKKNITIHSGGTFNSTKSEITLNKDSNSLTFKNNWNGNKITINVAGRKDATFSEKITISNLSEINEIKIQGKKVNLIHPPSTYQATSNPIGQEKDSLVAKDNIDNSPFKIQDIEIISGGKFSDKRDSIILDKNGTSIKLQNNWNSTITFKTNENKDSILVGESKDIDVTGVHQIEVEGNKVFLVVKSANNHQIVQPQKSNWSQYAIFGGVLLATLAGLFFFLKSKKRKQKTQEVSIKDSIQYRGKADTPIEQKQPLVSQTSATATRISEDEKRKIELETIRNLKAGTIPSHLRNDFDEIKRKLEQEVSTKLTSTTSTQINDLRNTKDKEIQTLKSQFLSTEQKLIDEKTSLISQISQLNSTAQNLNSEKTDLQRKLELSQPYSTEMQTFFNALEYSYAQLKNMASTANKNSRFYPTLSYILQGQSSRSTNAVFDVVKYNDGLMEVLGVNNLRDLKQVSKETFFNRYINNYFERTLTQIAQLNAYATANNSLNTASEIEKDGLAEIKNVFSVLNKAISEFGYRMIEPKLGEDHYDDNKHQKSNNSTLIHIAPEKIESVSSGKIYDIARIGFENLSGGTEVKTTVVCKL